MKIKERFLKIYSFLYYCGCVLCTHTVGKLEIGDKEMWKINSLHDVLIKFTAWSIIKLISVTCEKLMHFRCMPESRSGYSIQYFSINYLMYDILSTNPVILVTFIGVGNKFKPDTLKMIKNNMLVIFLSSCRRNTSAVTLTSLQYTKCS